MDITMESIISLLGLILGGSGGAFFTWQYLRKKAKAEADNAEVDTVKNMQDAYDKMINQVNHYIEDTTGKMDDLRADRDRYKKERDELRARFEKLEDSLRNMRNEYHSEKAETDRKIAQLGRKVEAMRPFLCGDLACKKRKLVALLDGEAAEPPKATKSNKAEEPVEPQNIEPINNTEL